MTMFIEEDDARRKWCPFAPHTGAMACIASECMMWLPERAKPENWQPGENVPRGRCGLAHSS